MTKQNPIHPSSFILHPCLDLSAAVQQGAGISRYERRLTEALLEIGGQEQYSYFYTAPNEQLNWQGPTHLPHLRQIVGNKKWRLKLLAAHLTGRKLDRMVFGGKPHANSLFHGMDYIAPPLSVPTVITVYDLSFIHYPAVHSRLNRNYLRLMLPLCARRASRIIAISENTKNDLVKWLGPQIADRIRVTPLGLYDESFFQDSPPAEIEATLAKYGLAKNEFILSVGTIEPRKNLVRLVEAYAHLVKQPVALRYWPASLVLVGRVGWQGEYERVKTAAAAHGLSFGEGLQPAQVRLLSNVDDRELKHFYKAAGVVAYPTIYEGFGLPALEAMAAGAPLVTSNNSSLPEVTGPSGEAALLVDAHSTEQLTQALQRLLTDRELAEQLRQRGQGRAWLFTWRQTAELTRIVYHEAIKTTG